VPESKGMNARGREAEVYTVSRLNREAKLLLEEGLPALLVEGEISNFSRPSSGHWYFSLKDEHAQVRCAMFRGANQRVRAAPREGLLVLVRARVSLYEPRGDYQLIVEQLEESGEGALRRRFEALKAKLEAEGLFDPAVKRALPRLPRRIGVITSPTGAAIRDVLHVLARRFPAVPVVIYPVPVQGAAAAPAIIAALAQANARGETDVILLARGGGSLEDLFAFNDEALARAIRASRLPVVTGIGHETDFSIADFAADLRAPTPSGAAELLVPDRAEWLRLAAREGARLTGAFGQRLRRERERSTFLARRLVALHPGRRLRDRAQRLDELDERLRQGLDRRLAERRRSLADLAARLARAQPELRSRALALRLLGARANVGMSAHLARTQARLELAARALNAVSPLATLARGYAIVRHADGRIVRAAREVEAGERITAHTADGILYARATGERD
jgi:exodeoxyribonuclease VII large subunit